MITREDFSELIENTKYRNRMSYIDAIIYICDEMNIELEDVPRLITKTLKRKIKDEGVDLHLVKDY